MRNKVAKQLRKEARSRTVGKNESCYHATNKTFKGVTYETSTLYLYPSCTRSVLQKLKRGHRALQISKL